MKWRSWEKWLLLGVTATAVAIAYFSGGGRGETATTVNVNTQPSKPLSSQPVIHEQQPPQQDSHVELERLSQQKTKEGKGAAIANAFNSTSWHVAPPPPPPPPPPEPTVPPLPFTYLGRYEDQQKQVVMLAKGDRLYTVSAGEMIDGTYRIERITDEAVELVYLPMKISQSISTIGASDNKQHRAGANEHNGRP